MRATRARDPSPEITSDRANHRDQVEVHQATPPSITTERAKGATKLATGNPTAANGIRNRHEHSMARRAAK
jgi:hypothetical protein